MNYLTLKMGLTDIRAFNLWRFDDAVLGALVRTLIESQIETLRLKIERGENVYSFDRVVGFEIDESFDDLVKNPPVLGGVQASPVCDVDSDGDDAGGES